MPEHFPHDERQTGGLSDRQSGVITFTRRTALLLHKHLASCPGHWPFRRGKKRACYVNGSNKGPRFVNRNYDVDFLFFCSNKAATEKHSNLFWSATLWWVSVAPQPRTTCHGPRRTLTQPPPPSHPPYHTRRLGRPNVDLWRCTAARSRWPPSCWAVFGLMNKPPSQTKTDLSWQPPRARRATVRSRFSRRPMDSFGGLVPRWRLCVGFSGSSWVVGLFSVLLFFLVSLNAEQLVDSWGGKMLIIFWPFYGDLCYCLFRE